MNKLKKNQKGFGVIGLLAVVVIVSVLSIAGWLVYKNTKNNVSTSGVKTTESTMQAEVKYPEAPSADFLDDEVAKIEKLVGPNCNSEMRELNKRDWFIASTEFVYYEDGGESDYQASNIVSSDNKFANIKYGCGSQGSTYVVAKQSNEWSIVAQSATVYSNCEDISGKNVPEEIMPKCYDTDSGSFIDSANL